MKRLLGLVLLTLLACISPQLAACEDPRYPILDSKFPAAEAKLGWIDNEHVVFHGYEVGKFGQKSTDDGHQLRETGLFIWDVPHNTVKKYWDIDSPVGLCVFHGVVAFKQRAKPGQDVWNVVTGDLTGAHERREEKKIWLNGISCRQHEQEPEWTSQDGHRRWALLEEHGYVDFGEQSMDPAKARPLVLYPPGSKEGVVLPLTSDQVEVPPVYVDFADAYLLRARQFTSDAVPVWLLKPNGTVAKIFAPQGQAWERMGWGHFYLTKKGLLLTGGRGDYGSVGTTGGYLLVSDKPVRIIAGFMRNAAVSPDGCKVAFVHSLHSQAEADSFRALLAGKPGTRSLKMIDLCKGD
jgi:hypothetical protein